MNKSIKPLIFFLVLSLIPTPAWANGGSPLMWGEVFHLLLGNMFIAIGESIVLSQFFGVPWKRAFGMMIVANYLSAWLAIPAIIVPFNNVGSILTLRRDFWIAVGLTWLFTLVVEWPFVFRGLKKESGRFKRSLKASLIVQTISYLVLFGFYGPLMEKSLVTEMDFVSLDEMNVPEKVVLYYADPEARSVRSRRLDGSNDRMIADLSQYPDIGETLVIQAREGDEKWVDLTATVRPDSGESKQVIVREKIAAPRDCFGGDASFPMRRQFPAWRNDDESWSGAVPVGTTEAHRWEFKWLYFFSAQLEGYQKGVDKFQIVYHTPFKTPSLRRPMQLPNDMVLLPCSTGELLLLDPDTRRIAVVLEDPWAVVVWDSN